MSFSASREAGALPSKPLACVEGVKLDLHSVSVSTLTPMQLQPRLGYNLLEALLYILQYG